MSLSDNCISQKSGSSESCYCVPCKVVAADRAGVGNRREARQLGFASLGVSIAGIVIGCIVVAITLGVGLSQRAASSTYYSSYCYSGYCFNGY